MDWFLYDNGLRQERVNYNWMEQLRFQYKKFGESGAFQETHISIHKTFRK